MNGNGDTQTRIADLLEKWLKNNPTGGYYTIQGYSTDVGKPIADYRPCVLVNVVVPDTKPDGTANNDLLTGDSLGQFKARVAGSESGEKRVDNLNQIYVRSKVAGSPCFYFVEVYF